MLILTRRVGETTYVTVPPSDKEQVITITVLGVKGNQVRTGTSAAANVGIDREEIYKRKQLERQKGHHAKR
jgi:carbon storage regulator